MDTPPPRDPSARATARRDRLAAPKRGKGPLYAAAGGVVVLLGVLYFLVLSAGKHDYSVDPSELPSEPTGDAVPVAFGIRAGDAFETHVATKGSMGLSVEQDLHGGGMTLVAQMTGRHDVSAKEGGGLSSSIVVKCDEFTTNVPTDDSFVPGQTAFTVRFDRDAKGRPVQRSAVYDGLEGSRPRLLAILMAGLSDWTTDYLPARPVRVGEAWDLSEVVETQGVEEVVRFVSGMGARGFPPLVTRGRVKVVSHEEHEGEDSLRLRLSLASNVKGRVERPAHVGSISAGLKVDGDLWVSTRTGLLLETDFEASLLSIYEYDEPKTKNERRIAEHVHAKTTRAAPR